MTVYVVTTADFTGSDGGDLIVQVEDAGPPGSDVLNGANGNDVIIADHDLAFYDGSQANNTIDTAVNVDDAAAWSNSPTNDVEASAVPYTTVAGRGMGQLDVFSVSVGLGQTITIDVDYASKPTGLAGDFSFDSYVALMDASGTVIASNDDNGYDLGSQGGLDSALSYTVAAGGIFYFSIRALSRTDVPVGAAYLINISVSGHAFSNTVISDDDTLYGGAGNDLLQGNGGNDTFFAGVGADLAYGGAGDDRFYDESDAASDIFYGGDGNDSIYIVANGGAVGFYDMQGSDTISAENSSAAWTLDAGAGSGSSTGSSITFTAAGAIERLIGSAYADTLIAAVGGTSLSGGGGNDSLYGAGGNDVIDGGDGDDTMQGGGGTDRVSYASAGGGVIVELSQTGPQGTLAGGTDTLTGFVNLTGSAYGDSLGGSDAANSIDGGGGDDYIAGGIGNDVLDGGAGFDIATYFNSQSVVKVNLNVTTSQNTGQQGFDTLVNIEGLWGSNFNDILTGNNADNWLQGGFGADTLTGGNGNDRYMIDDAGDKVIENSGQGGDTVLSSVTYSLAGQFIEVLSLMGNSAINGSGNSLANTINGNSGANILNGGDGNDRLDGGGGADKLIGGLGNDVFAVDNAADKIVENNGEGNDTVEASITYSLAGQYIETLRLTGVADINGTGNGLVNNLYGNSGANRLDGGGGADNLYGGAGSDRYIVDNAGDKVFELAGEGIDTVEASVSYSLAGQYADHLTLTGTAAINGTGNGLNNNIFGNGGANVLSGGSGDDQLYGRAGADTLTGGVGEDIFGFDTALGSGNIDTIKDYTALDDLIVLSRLIFTALPEGIVAGEMVHTGSAAADATDRIIYDQATGKLYYDPDGTGAAAQVQFAFIANHATAEIDENSFFVI